VLGTVFAGAGSYANGHAFVTGRVPRPMGGHRRPRRGGPGARDRALAACADRSAGIDVAGAAPADGDAHAPAATGRDVVIDANTVGAGR
jgi:hypothetical protein